MAAHTAQSASAARSHSTPGTVLLGFPFVTGDEGRPSLSWLVQLHWWAILGQLLVIGVAEVLSEIRLPIGALVTLLVLESVGNVWLGIWTRRAHVSHGIVAAVMLVDAAVLTVLLDLTGGASNPFSTLYLVNVALAAILLPPRWVVALVVASLAGFASLFFHEQATTPAHHVHMGMTPQQVMNSHLRGMWVAFALAAGFIVYFVRRVMNVLAEREAVLSQARALVQRREKLASLATLAAGAAHELSTPLGTIRLAAAELERSLERAPSPTPGDLREDVRLIRSQVERCREILERMAADAGQSAGEGVEEVPVGELVERALRSLQPGPAVQLSLDESVRDATVRLPPRAVAGAVRALCKNAQQASGEGGVVELGGSLEGGVLRLSVRDRGEGMSPEVLAHAGEPFFTTKPPGAGMGLGLFLARALAQRLGGELSIDSRLGQGTVATLALPRSAGDDGGGARGAIVLRRDS